MPFTLSHPAIVLPLKLLKRRWFSVNGLIIGSMSPDIAYLFELDLAAKFGHSYPGIFMFDIPITVLVALVFHRWVRNVLIRHFPSPLDIQYAPVLQFNFLRYLRRHWHVFLISALIGALSHLFWDSLAYPFGPINYLWPEFFGRTLTIAGVTASVPLFIEHTGSTLGLLVMILAFFRYKPQAETLYFQPLSGSRKRWFWASISLLAWIIAKLKLIFLRTDPYLGQLIVIIISAGCLSVLSVTTLLHLRKNRNPLSNK
jgi:hypothetical protein